MHLKIELKKKHKNIFIIYNFILLDCKFDMIL